MIISTFYFLLILISVAYFMIIGIINLGWFKLKTYKPSGKEPKTRLSVIIPAKNEEENIADCLNDLIRQDYPKELFEIIIVDDGSTDNTYRIVSAFIDSNTGRGPNITLIRSEAGDKLIAGKKEAIRSGIKISSAEVILTSDADCRFNRKWISMIADYFENNDIKLLTGGVNFRNTKTIFQKMQVLEFLSLIVSGAGFIGLGFPILGNAANLSFRKEAFLEVEKYRIDYDHSSGDDIFLIHKIKKHYRASAIGFLKNRDAIVLTEPITTLRALFSQRMRWVSKSRKYKDPVITIVAWITFLFNFLLITGFAISAFYPQYLCSLIILLIIKIIVEFSLMLGIASFTKRRSLLWLFILLEITNIFYVVIIAFAGYFGKAKWKGKDVY